MLGVTVNGPRRLLGMAACVWWLVGTAAQAQLAWIDMGNKAPWAMGQPRLNVQVLEEAGDSIGPRVNGTFLLDTGADSIYSFARATSEMKQAGYQVEGTYEQPSASGSAVFDVSAKYDVKFRGNNGQGGTLEDVRLLSSETVEIDATMFWNIDGVLGMPALVDRVATLDYERGTVDGFGVELFTALSDHLPPGRGHRYTVELSPLEFIAEEEADSLSPTHMPLPELTAKLVDGCRAHTTRFVVQTGAQMSMISTETAIALGLDKDGDGGFAQEAVDMRTLVGIGGTIHAPVVKVPQLRLQTNEGVELVWNQLRVLVQDFDPRVDAVFGIDFFSGSTVFPLNSDLERVHFDFREFPEGGGALVIDMLDSLDEPLEIVSPQTLGDTNFDDSLNIADIERLADNWGTEVAHGAACGDLNGDQWVNINDLVLLAEAWDEQQFGAPPDWQTWLESMESVPEPGGGAALVAMGWLVAGSRRRRRIP